MPKSDAPILRFFDKIVIGKPRATLIFLLAVILILGFFAKDFKIDASSETLIKESDEGLKYARQIDERYGVHDFLIIAYAPKKDLLSDAVLKDISSLQKDLKQIDRVDSVITILDVPMLESPPLPIKKLAEKIPTLKSPEVDRNLARIELKTSPIYRNLIVSPDLKTTAIQINFKRDNRVYELIKRKDFLREKLSANGLTAGENAEYERVKKQIDSFRDTYEKNRHEDIRTIRAIMNKYRGKADLFLGGVSMIADDLIQFVKNDLEIFGIGVFCFLVLTLGIIFRKARWVLLPMLCCVCAAVAMIGMLGLFGWDVTVISSNFISLQLIITMAVSIHLIVRYREIIAQHPDYSQRQLVYETVRLKLTPCFYAALTTIAGFSSLLACDILPVVTFGWMMAGGIIVSLIITFILFPAGMMIIGKSTKTELKESEFSLAIVLSKITESHGKMILIVSVLLFLLSLAGISRLVVENAFINYFKKSTEIYQGMKLVDQELGGTTPLDVIIDLDNNPIDDGANHGFSDASITDNTFDSFDEFDEVEEKEDAAKYWFTRYKMNQVLKVHDYLQSLPDVGKVLSLGTIMKMATRLNHGKPLDSFELSLVYNEIPDQLKELLVNPYASVAHNQVRFFVRVKDSEKDLRRNELLKKIDFDLTHKLGYKPEKVHLSGLLVLYNNMLQSLFKSQILTLGIVVLALMSMFLILFRSIRIALIAIFPNLLATGVVLGVMGWFRIPLDMMTITIAAISVGIAVDDTIHYIHRFGKEIRVDGDYIKAMHRCHGSIGHAMYYTSLTIIIGFSILSLSNFIPSIIFGLMTGLAMFIALISALTLLPQLIVLFKPFDPGKIGA